MLRHCPLLLLSFLLIGCSTTRAVVFPKWEPIKNSVVHEALPPLYTVDDVDKYVNKFRYIKDIDNYGVPDYWATPDEFLSRGGGDCEDYAITKYFIILQLHLYSKRPVLLLVWDNQSHLAHVVLEVDGKILDNQNKPINTYTLLGVIQ